MKKYSKRVICLLIALTLSLGLLSGCGSEAPAPAPAEKENASDAPAPAPEKKEARDSLTFVTWIKHTTYDVTAGGVADKGINHAIFDTLMKYGPNGSYDPMLAESIEDADNGAAVILHLRKDVTFHDGSPFSADDVIYFFDKAMEGRFAVSVKAFVKGWEKIDDYTVKLIKTNIYANVPAFLCERTYIMPKAAHSKDPEAFNKHPIGTGPYTFVKEEDDGSVILKAYDNYYGKPAGVPNVRVQLPLDPSAAVIALETGSADFITGVPNSQHPVIESNPDLRLCKTDAWDSIMVLMMGKRLNSDINLRKAIYYGINRENALMFGAEGEGSVCEQIFSDRMMGKYAGQVPIEGYDLEKAKAALAESNYDGTPVRLTITDTPALAESIQSDLKQVGIDVQIEQTDFSALLQKFQTGDLDLYQTPMGNGTMTPQSLLKIFSETGKQIGENMYSSKEYNALVQEIETMTEDSHLDEKTLEGLKMLRDAYSGVNLYKGSSNYALSADFVYDYPSSATTMVYYYADIMPNV